jgi:hypothetical protein
MHMRAAARAPPISAQALVHPVVRTPSLHAPPSAASAAAHQRQPASPRALSSLPSFTPTAAPLLAPSETPVEDIARMMLKCAAREPGDRH